MTYAQMRKCELLAIANKEAIGARALGSYMWLGLWYMWWWYQVVAYTEAQACVVVVVWWYHRVCGVHLGGVWWCGTTMVYAWCGGSGSGSMGVVVVVVHHCAWPGSGGVVLCC